MGNCFRAAPLKGVFIYELLRMRARKGIQKALLAKKETKTQNGTMCPKAAASPKELDRTWKTPERGNETETVKTGVNSLLYSSKNIHSLKDLECKVHARNKRF